MDAPYTPERLVTAATAAAWQLIDLPEHEQRAELARLCSESPTLHAMIRQQLDDLRKTAED